MFRNQVCLILWKNLLLARNRMAALICQNIIPLFIFLAAVIMVLVKLIFVSEAGDGHRDRYPDHERGYSTYSSYCPARFNGSNCKDKALPTLLEDKSLDILAYSPHNSLIDSVMQTLGKVLHKKIKGFSNSKELENHFSTPDRRYTLTGIQFDDDLADKPELPATVNITFRFLPELLISHFDVKNEGMNSCHTNMTASESRLEALRDSNMEEAALPFHLREGFLGLQQVVAYLLILGQQKKLVEGNAASTLSQYNSMPEIIMERTAPRRSSMSDSIKITLIILLVVTYSICCGTFTSTIVKEKEQKIKEALKINNLRDWANLLAWCISGMLEFSISGLLIYAAHVVGWSGGYALCQNSGGLFLLLMFLMIEAYFVTVCLLMSTFFSRGARAGFFCTFIIAVMYLPFYFSEEKKIGTIILVSFVPTSGVSFMLNQMYELEIHGLGARFSTVWKATSAMDKYCLGYGILIMVFEMVLFMLLYLYLEAIMPREYGVPMPWNFLCMKSYWSGKPDTSEEDQLSQVEEEARSAKRESKFIEDDPKNMAVGVEVKDLKKVFGGQVAVNRVSFKMFENQVTVLLGPNGAGKSTIIAMIVGVLRPTSGTAILNGYDIRTQQQKARQNVGICPQFNMMYATLTIEEHLILFCKLRGVKKPHSEVQRYLQATKLTDKRGQICKELSGGMKRRLCIALAFCGNAKVVLLDEPTSGVDPTLRRDIWDLIVNEKKGKTILLTTHFMDEAEVLGDKIVIIAEGEIKCMGSSFFLKKKYDTGYQLVIEKAPKCNPAQVTSFLSNYISRVKIHTDAGTKLTYMLSEQYVDYFPGMLGDLDKNLDRLNIKSYGVELATMEEVFLKAGARENVAVAKRQRMAPGESNRKELVTGIALISQQYHAMLAKRFMSVIGSICLHLSIIFLPVTCLLIHYVIIKLSPGPTESRTRMSASKFSLDHFDNPTILIETVDTPNKYEDSFRSVVLDNKGKLLDVPDVKKFIVKKSEKYRNQEFEYLYGVRFDASKDSTNDRLKIWFNNYHTPGLGMQLVLDAIYKKELGSDHALKFYREHASQDQEREIAISYLYHVLFLVSFTLLVSFYITERVSNSKHLQLTMGMNTFIFWSSAYIIDLLICLITVGLFVIVVAVIIPVFKSAENSGLLFLVLMLFSAAYLTRVYMASLCFSNSLLAFISLYLISILEKYIPFLIITIIKEKYTEYEYPDVDGANVAEIKSVAFENTWTCLFCVHSLAKAIGKLETRYDEIHEESGMFNYTKTGINYHIWSFAISAVVGWIVIFFIDLGVSPCIMNCISNTEGDYSNDSSDQDVAEEKFKIQNTPQEELIKDNVIVLDSISKRYWKSYAVKDLNLTIHSSECFGLLGTNGAGKTTTFKILTGEIRMFDGEAWVHGYNIRTQLGKIHKDISYCPQFDALIESITVKNTLKMYCLIKGIRSKECSEVIEKLAQDFDFKQHLHKKIYQLSGGNKRKVSASISMIGDADIIYMDEPTTGMDVSTRRHLWNQIIKAYASGKSIVLTTHSMEESEALCTKVGIMVNGELICLGAVQYLKSKFVKGRTITLKIRKDADIKPIDTYIKANFPDTTCIEEHVQFRTYSVESEMSWSDMFRLLQKAKSDKLIEDYTITQPSLEQVFLTLTKNQKTTLTTTVICC